MAQPKKTGLGKGLDALFGGVSINEQPQETVVEEKSEINDNLKSLKITEVEPNRDQPRKQFKQEALEDLAESIKTYGIKLKLTANSHLTTSNQTPMLFSVVRNKKWRKNI